MPKKRSAYFDPKLIKGLEEAFKAFHKAMAIEYKKKGIKDPKTQYMKGQVKGFAQPTHSNWLTNKDVKGSSLPLTVADDIRKTLGRGSEQYDKQLQDVWGSPSVNKAKTALKTFISQYIAQVSQQDARDAIERAEVHELPHLLIADQAKGWNRINSAFYEIPDDAEGVQEAAIAYLRGDDEGAAWPKIKVAFHRSRYVLPILEALDKSPVVLVTAPVGEGKSTIVAQVAEAVIGLNRPVFWINDASAFDQSEFVDEIQWQRDRPLIILDDLLLGERLPVWVAWPPGQKAGNILIANHTRHSEKLSRSIGSVRYQSIPIADVSNDEVKEIILCLHTHCAVPCGQSVEKTQELMTLALKFNRALWPAQYAATRGYSLYERINRLLWQIQREPDGHQKLYALAAITMANRNLSFSRKSKEQCKALPKRSLIQRMARAIDDLNPAFKESICYHIDYISDFIEGELLKRNYAIYNDPEVHFRHPEVARSMDKLLFDSPKNGRHPARFNRWDFLEPLCASLPQDKFQATDMQVLLKRAIKAWSYGGSERHKHDLHEIVESCVEKIVDCNDRHVQARIELLRAQAILLDTTQAHCHESQAFAGARIEAACGLVSNSTPFSVDMDIAETLVTARIDVNMKVDGSWHWRNWRFFTERAEATCTKNNPGPNQANKRIFQLLLKFPDQAEEGELVEYANKSGLLNQKNWECFVAAVRVCENQIYREFGNHLAPNENVVPTLSEHYDLPFNAVSALSFHAILLHLWSILVIKSEDILEEMKDTSHWKQSKNYGQILNFTDLMSISLNSKVAGWLTETKDFFRKKRDFDPDWITQASKLYGAEVTARWPDAKIEAKA